MPRPAGRGFIMNSAIETPPHRHDALLAALVEHTDVMRPRYTAHAARLFDALHALYGTHPAYAQWLPDWLQALAEVINERPAELARLDAERTPGWFGHPSMLGYSAYADRFAGNLRGVAERTPYLQELGVRYLHLLPFLRMREGDNDGGFAVSDYGQVDPRLGSNADLRALTARLREANISLCADFVLNHTADDHPWVVAARAGDTRYRDYYHLFADRQTPDAYESTLGEIFPHTAPGNFTWIPEAQAWAWTTFYPFQWDLNWSNPQVFGEMALALLRLANLGVEAFRLDSTAFLWKRPGTDCMNQPEAHVILQALRAMIDIAAPSVVLKAEAIVPMAQLPPYFGEGANTGHECHLAYHSTLMAAGWSALALQRGDILHDVIAHSPPLPSDCAWLSYVRCHDDIGWNVLRSEAAGRDGNPPFALADVARFFAGKTPGSYARGEPFQSDGDGVHGSNGMAAALVGIEEAQARGDTAALAIAIDRLVLLYALALAMPGVPLIYMGDELALGNDRDFRHDPERRHEGRWLHRPVMDWARAEVRHDQHDIAGQVYTRLRRLIEVRQQQPDLDATRSLHTLPLSAPQLFLLARGEGFVGLYNFGAETAEIDLASVTGHANWIVLTDGRIDPPAYENAARITLSGYGVRWLQRR
jgi:amylosucrase